VGARVFPAPGDSIPVRTRPPGKSISVQIRPPETFRPESLFRGTGKLSVIMYLRVLSRRDDNGICRFGLNGVLRPLSDARSTLIDGVANGIRWQEKLRVSC